MGRVISISKLAQHYIFTLDLRDCMCLSVELDQFKNVTLKTYQICPDIVHEPIFLPKVAKNGQ